MTQKSRQLISFFIVTILGSLILLVLSGTFLTNNEEGSSNVILQDGE